MDNSKVEKQLIRLQYPTLEPLQDVLRSWIAMREALEKFRKAHGHVAGNDYDFDYEDREVLEHACSEVDLALQLAQQAHDALP